MRIFELAKELGIPSKDVIALFARLGVEAKNHMSVVDDKLAEVVRGVLLGKGGGGAAPAAPIAKPAPAKAAAAKPAPPKAVAPAPLPDEPIPQLKPVTSARRAPLPAASEKPVPLTTAATAQAPVAALPAPVAAAPSSAPVSASASIAKAAPAIEVPASEIPASEVPASEVPAPKPAQRRAAPLPQVHEPVVQLKPVPAGQSTIARPRPPSPPPPEPLAGTAASATPGPQTGIPGRPGVAPRPGQPGIPGQGYQPRPGQAASPNGNPVRPGAPGIPAAPGVAGRPTRPLSNGPFRPLGPPGPRPFTPRPPGNGPMPTGTPGSAGPNPSAGTGAGRPTRGHYRDVTGSKKDREQAQLLDKARNRKQRGQSEAVPAIPSATLTAIEIPDLLTVQQLAQSMSVPAKDVIKELIKMGTMATINQNVNSDIAIQIAKKFGFAATIKEAGDEVVVQEEEDQPGMLTTRPPVVTVLGHVDHGKTSLLDKIRVANVAGGEAGGITQRIGAYTVEKDDRKITFIDTPGHEAFTAMRARGAKVTDVAILVVAADDGVMPQTIEAIAHIKAADVPIVVAINKMDKADAQPERVKQQLTDHGLQPVEWGGKTEMVQVSARNGEGITQLLETVLLEADIRDLKANKNRRASGVVIESALDRGRGAVATVLVQNGTLRVGDIVVVGGAFGKIRALVDDKGKQVKKAGPSIPVEIMGLSDVPAAGDTLMVVSDERVARETAAKRSTRRRDVRISATSSQKVTLESFMGMPAEGGTKTLNLVIKADGQGSVEALRSRVEGLSNPEVDIRVIYAGVGGITPNDVSLSSASNAVLIGFNIRPDETVKRLAENEGVDLRMYQVIYDIENDLKRAMAGMLEPKFREITTGRAEIREVFKVSKVGTIAGCYVLTGKIARGAKIRVLRDSAIVFEGEIETLRRFKDDVREVQENFECGIQIAKFSDLKQGDVIEAFASELVAPEPVGV